MPVLLSTTPRWGLKVYAYASSVLFVLCCFFFTLGAADHVHESILAVEERCPKACSRNGLCTSQGCACYLFYEGEACEHSYSSPPLKQDQDQAQAKRAEKEKEKEKDLEGGVHGQPSSWPRLPERRLAMSHHGKVRNVCVVSAQVPHTLLDEREVESSIPAFESAKAFTSEGYAVTLVFLVLNGNAQMDSLAEQWGKRLQDSYNIELKVIFKTQHYYMPSMVSQSFELYSWIRDRVRVHGKSPFDSIVLHDSHGLGYYLGLGKRQDAASAGLDGTSLVVNLAVPHLWLVTEGSEIGVTSVDDIEVNHIEKEAIRLADHVLVQYGRIFDWCSARKWRFPASTFVRDVDRMMTQDFGLDATGSDGHNRSKVLSLKASHWQSVDLHPREKERDARGGQQPAPSKAGGEGFHLYFVMQGPGGGQQGEMVSSGGNKMNSVYFQVSEQHKFDMMQWDIETINAATELLLGLGVERFKFARSKLQGVTILITGIEDKTLPLQIKSKIAAIEQKWRDKMPLLSFQFTACKFSEAAQIMAEDAGGEQRRFAVLANYHRDTLTFEWLHQLVVKGCNAAYLSSGSEITRGIVRDLIESSRSGREDSQRVVDSVPSLVDWIFPPSERSPTPSPDPKRVKRNWSSFEREHLNAFATPALLDYSNLPLPGKMQSLLAANTAFNVVRNLLGPLESPQGSSPLKDEFVRTSVLPFVSVIITHYNRPEFLEQAIKSIAYQSYPETLLELIIIDDGSPDPGVKEKLVSLGKKYSFESRGWHLKFEPNRYLGGARNAGVGYAKGKYILFMDDDNYAKSYEVEYFVRAMERTHADIMTSGLDFITGKKEPESTSCYVSRQENANINRVKCFHKEGRMIPYTERNTTKSSLITRASPSFVFLGASSNVGLFKNCYGDANSFFRKEAFHLLGGYTTDKHVGYEDWEVYSKASLNGFNLQTVPRAMYFYRFTSGSMQKTTSYRQSRKRALRAYLD